MSEIEFQALGSIGFATGGPRDADGLLAQPKRLALFCFLAIPRPGRLVRRDTLLGVFWPDCDTDHARTSLRQALKHIRQTLGSEVIVRRGWEEVGLNSELLSCDVAKFEQALDAGDWAKAVEQYRGELLKGFFLSKALEFERWLENERARLASRQAHALEELAKAATQTGDVRAAVEWWQALVRHDPFDSRYVTGLMEVLDRAGDPANALIYAREYRALLREELDITLPAEIKAVEDRVRMNRAPGGSDQTREQDAREVATDKPVATAQGGASGKSKMNRRWQRLKRLMPRLPIVFGIPVALYAIWLVPKGGTELHDRLVIVVPFENFTGDAAFDELGQLAADWIRGSALRVGEIDVVPGALGRGSSIVQSGNAADRDVRTMAEEAGAGLSVAGAITSNNDSLRYNVEIVKVSEGTVLQSFDEVWPKEATREAIRNVAQRVSGALAAEADPYMSVMARAMPLPPTLEAYREHRLGYALVDIGEYEESLKHQLAAYALDTTLVRAIVAAGYAAREYTQKDSLACFAERRRHLLSRAGRLDLDILVAMLARRWEDARQASAALAQLEGGYAHVATAWFAVRANRPMLALESLAEYDPEPEWRRDEADKYWHVLTVSHHMLARHEEELVESRRARERYPDRMDLLNTEVRALAALGRDEQVERLLDTARSFSPHHDFAYWQLLYTAGTEFREHGYSEDYAQAAFLRAAGWLRNRPREEAAEPDHVFALARSLYSARRWEESHQLFQQLVTEYPESANRVDYLGHLGTVAGRMGDPALATGISTQLDEIDIAHLDGKRICWKARIAAVLGDAHEAMALLRAAFREGQEFGIWLNADLDLESLHTHRDFQELVRPTG